MMLFGAQAADTTLMRSAPTIKGGAQAAQAQVVAPLTSMVDRRQLHCSNGNC